MEKLVGDRHHDDDVVHVRDRDNVRCILIVPVLGASARSLRAFPRTASVLVDGEDPFAQPGAPVGLSRRLYRTPEGVAGSPTVGQLVEVLARGVISEREGTPGQS